jgi:hypothetical protein
MLGSPSSEGRLDAWLAVRSVEDDKIQGHYL